MRSGQLDKGILVKLFRDTLHKLIFDHFILHMLNEGIKDNIQQGFLCILV